MDVEKFPNWLRWLLVPIAVIVSLIAVSIASALFFWFQGKMLGLGEGAWLDRIWQNIFGPGVSAFAAVYSGVYVAPLGKKATAIVIGIVMLLVSGATMLVTISQSNWWGLLAVLATVGGVGFSVNEIFNEEQKKSR